MLPSRGRNGAEADSIRRQPSLSDRQDPPNTNTAVDPFEELAQISRFRYGSGVGPIAFMNLLN